MVRKKSPPSIALGVPHPPLFQNAMLEICPKTLEYFSRNFEGHSSKKIAAPTPPDPQTNGVLDTPLSTIKYLRIFPGFAGIQNLR